MKTTEDLAQIAKEVQAILVNRHLSYAEMYMVLSFAQAILVSVAIKDEREVKP